MDRTTRSSGIIPLNWYSLSSPHSKDPLHTVLDSRSLLTLNWSVSPSFLIIWDFCRSWVVEPLSSLSYSVTFFRWYWLPTQVWVQDFLRRDQSCTSCHWTPVKRKTASFLVETNIRSTNRRGEPSDKIDTFNFEKMCTRKKPVK